MNKVSRRNLATYAADRLASGDSARSVAKELVSILVVDKRLNETELLVKDIAYELETSGKLAVANVTTAHELSAKLSQEIKSLVKTTAKVDSVILNELTDKKVIAGVRIETASKVWDMTALAQIKQIREIA